jgi:hypothetical protein
MTELLPTIHILMVTNAGTQFQTPMRRRLADRVVGDSTIIALPGDIACPNR